VWKAAIQLLSELDDEDAILVEAFYETVSRNDKHVAQRNRELRAMSINWRATDENAARVRATAVRMPNNKARCVKVCCHLQFYSILTFGVLDDRIINKFIVETLLFEQYFIKTNFAQVSNVLFTFRTIFRDIINNQFE